MVDALIIGGGPAGATTALLLAQAGWSVAVIEKKIFPRPKVCGEYISATNLPLLAKLGLGDFYQAHAGPAIQRVGWFAANKTLTAAMPAADNGLGKWGCALGRDQLDTALLAAAQQAGAEIWQPWSAHTLADHGSHYTCTLTAKEQTAYISARMVVIAHGSWEQPLLKTAATPHKKTDLLAFKAHFSNCKLDQDLMALLTFPGGYGGLVHSDNERVTLSCCIRRDRLQQIRLLHPGSAGDAVLNYVSNACAGVHTALSPSQQVDQWLAAGPLRPGIRTRYAQGIFYVGNIAGEAHPIIAEGISMALQSGWLLAQSLLAQPTLLRTDLDRIGRCYSKQWRAQFAPRIHAAALFAHMTTRPYTLEFLLPLVQRFPGLLSYGATLSGKVKEVIASR